MKNTINIYVVDLKIQINMVLMVMSILTFAMLIIVKLIMK